MQHLSSTQFTTTKLGILTLQSGEALLTNLKISVFLSCSVPPNTSLYSSNLLIPARCKPSSSFLNNHTSIHLFNIVSKKEQRGVKKISSQGPRAIPHYVLQCLNYLKRQHTYNFNEESMKIN